jgi:hypothetical protein
MKPQIFFIVYFLANIAAAEKARYDHYRVYELEIENDVHLELMNEIEKYPDLVKFF